MKFSAFVMLYFATFLIVGCETSSKQSASDQKKFDPSQSDPQAIRIANEVTVALGGRKKYEAINYLSFRFVMEVDTQKVSDWRHDWDRRNNNYRLESITREGDHVLVVFNLDTRKGAAFKNGQTLEGEEKLQLLSRAYARFINDTYWLLMPYKLKDPGVVLKYEGVQKIQDVNYDVLRLSFADSIGLAPWNIYRVFVDQATRLVHRWEYFEKEGATPVAAWWEQWRGYGGIKLAELRIFENSKRRIRFLDIVVSREVDEKIFEVATTNRARMF
jgi:hypothetical protein